MIMQDFKKPLKVSRINPNKLNQVKNLIQFTALGVFIGSILGYGLIF